MPDPAERTAPIPPRLVALRRLDKYQSRAETLRQIHSDKTQTLQSRSRVYTITVIVLSAAITFLAFTGTGELQRRLAGVSISISQGAIQFLINVVIFLLLVAVILDLVFRFRERSTDHWRSIVLLTAFIRDVDDLIALEAFEDHEAEAIVREVRERYKLIGELLPPSSDKEYRSSKQRLLIKREESRKRRLAQLTGSSEFRDLSEREMERSVASLVEEDPWMMAVIRAVHSLGDTFWVSGGFVRNRVWDKLHGYSTPTSLDDVDVIYFDPASPADKDVEYEHELRGRLPNVPWSVKNQADMHHRAGDQPYESIEDALSKYPETATAIAVRLNSRGTGVEFLAPAGFADLLALRVRPTDHFLQHAERYEQRLAEKGWTRTWPRLQIVHLASADEVGSEAESTPHT